MGAIATGIAVASACALSAVPAVDAEKPAFEGSRVRAIAADGRGGITLEAGKRDSAIVVKARRATGTAVITDDAGIRIDARFPRLASRCDQITKTKVRCAFLPPGGILARLGPGDDSIDIDTGAFAPVKVFGDIGSDLIHVSNPSNASSSRIKGNGGADKIVAGPSAGYLYGGPGNDLVRGRFGMDLISGDSGADALSGGGGSDQLEARDGERDRSIDCGPRGDHAEFDMGLDPTPVRCS